MSDLLRRIEETEGRARALEERLADPDVAAKPGEFAEAAKELGRLRPLLDAGARYRKLLADLEGARALLEESDEDLRKEAREEVARVEPEIEATTSRSPPAPPADIESGSIFQRRPSA